MDAERVYFFRHALLRDAAYQLQLPGARARLHGLALAAIEGIFGGRPPTPPPLEAPGPLTPATHPSDPWAEELAGHARFALSPAAGPGVSPDLVDVEKTYVRRAAEQGERHFRLPAARVLWERYAELSSGVEKAESLRRAGGVAQQAGLLRIAEPLFESALALVAESGNGRIHGAVLVSVAALDREMGRIDQAELRLQRAIALHRDRADRRNEGIALGGLGNLFRETARQEQAEPLLLESLAILREFHDRRLEGITLSNLATLTADTGREALAGSMFLEAAAIHRECGNRRSEAVVLGNLAVLFGRTQRTAEAERAYLRALELNRDIGDRRLEGVTLGNYAGLLAFTGRAGQAEEFLRQAIDIHRDVGNRRFEGVHQLELAGLKLRQGRVEEARADWAPGAAILREVRALPDLERQKASARATCERLGIEFPEADEL
ncbi:MAG: tetratricopeptide repeat protein [Planctomycetota bacterium]